MRKFFILFTLIYLFSFSKVYATDEIISSQMESLNISSFVKEGEKYTKDTFPDIDLNNLLNSAIRGEIDNNKIYRRILSIFGDEIVSSISLLGSILIIIIIHSLLKNFTENLNKNEGIGQIAYYVEYILIVTLVMANFSFFISMIKESIANLVGFINSLIPILLALMSATRKYSICYFNTTIYSIFSCIYWKHYNNTYSSYNFNCYSIRNCFKFI